MAYISFGKYNANYKFVILTGIFMILKIYLLQLLIAIFSKKETISEYTANLFDHKKIIDNFRLFGMLIFSIIIYIYEKKSSQCGENPGNSEKSDSSKSQISEKGLFRVIKDNIIIIVIICSFIEFFSDIISSLSFFTYWMAILLIISYINEKVFNLEMYKHQKLSIYFSFIVSFIFQLSCFILSMNSEEIIDKNIYKDHLELWFLPIGLIIHFAYVSLSSFIYSKMKWLMDAKYIYLGKLFMIYSIVSFIFNIIGCVVLTYIKCSGEVGDFFCEIYDEDDSFLENFSLFYDDILVIYKNYKNDFTYIIIIIFVDMIIFSLYIYFFLSILKNLKPEYFFFLGSITSIFSQIFVIIKNKVKEGYYFAQEEKDFKLLLTKFLFIIIGNSLAVIGFLVYLEIIELHFCNLDYNIRRKIIERGLIDIIDESSAINEDQNKNLIDDNTRKTELSINNN